MTSKEIDALGRQVLAEIEALDDAEALQQLRSSWFGRQGRMQELMAGLKHAEADERPKLGQACNQFKQQVQAAIEARREALEDQPGTADGGFDYSLPGYWHQLGTHHPVSQIIDRVSEVFRRIGFTVATGPDVETVHHNFDALNTPPDHPARDPGDTFYFDDEQTLLRTQTSPVQIRYMEANPPPVRIVAPGRCYRRDDEDATHTANFHQIEGLYVAENVSMADLKGDLTYFAREVMSPDTKVRFRPHFFPFTEPSVEVDFSCHVCRGSGCRVCKQSGWIEIAGAGMVDPNVFRAVDYDPEGVSGYAFGMGIERIAMILFEFDDIRRLYSNQTAFLQQF